MLKRLISIVYNFFIFSLFAEPTNTLHTQYSHIIFNVNQEIERSPCEVHGTLPEWLTGTLLRNGPAQFSTNNASVSHWFDGLAMLHAFECANNKVWYSNKFLRSQQYHEMHEEGKIDFSGFAQDPCRKAFAPQLSAHIPFIHNADVSIASYAKTMVALTETPLPVMFNPQTLETLGVYTYQDELPKSQCFESAHPHFDLARQETINYLTRFQRKSDYVIWKMDENSPTRKIIAEVPVDYPAYMHSFALTERYIVLVEFPFVVNPKDLMMKNTAFIKNFSWQPERNTRFTLIDRTTGALIAQLFAEPFFAFHHVNAYDKDDAIIIDIITYPNSYVVDRITKAENDAENRMTRLERFTISLSKKSILRKTLLDNCLEMPRIAPSHAAKEYRYCYAVDYRFPLTKTDIRPLYKCDVTNCTKKMWVEEGCYPGEPIFIPRPGATKEDDGIVASVVLDFCNHSSFLLLLDAETFTEIARAKAPHAIPAGLHGTWKP